MLNPNIIGAIQTIEIAQVEQLEVVLDEKQPVIDEQHPIQIIDVSGLIIELEDKASLTQLQSETNQRISDDISLNDAIILKASQLDLTAEEDTRAIADNNLQNNLNDEIQNRTLSDNALAGLIFQRATILSLNAEITDRTNGDTNLQNNLNTETQGRLTGDTNLNLAINAEAQQRINADNDLLTLVNTKLDEANSIHRDNFAFYCVDGRNDLHSVLPNVNNQGAYISVSSGSFGNTTPLTIDKDNLSIFSVPSTPPIVEFACPLTIASTANRIRTRYMSFDGVCNLNGKRCVYTHSTFNNNVNIGAGTTEFMTFANCEFSAGKTITFSSTMASVVYIIECNISGATLVFNNASPLQVIFSNCSGFQSFPTTSQAMLVGLNVLATGVSQHNISQIILPIGSGSSGQVLTSGGAGSVNTWSTPSGGGGSDIIKECFARYCLGQSVSTSYGNITLPNITSSQLITANTLTWVDLTGSEITYIPPTGSTFVEYELDFYCYTFTAGTAIEASFALAFYIDGIPQNITREKIILASSTGGQGEGQMKYKFKALVSIGGSTDRTKSQVDSWNTSKTIKLQVKREQTRNITFHFVPEMVVPYPSTAVETTIVAPLIKITAY